MTRRIHHTTRGGKTFTFEEWAAFLDKYPDFQECDLAFESFEGFDFNVHGHCLNPHEIKIGEDKYPNPVAWLRTYIAPHHLHGPLTWWFECYSLRCGCHAYGRVSLDQDEKDAKVAGLRKMRESLISHIAWLDKFISYAQDSNSDSGHKADKERDERMLAAVENALENEIQYTLF